jgi:hypothetical protein
MAGEASSFDIRKFAFLENQQHGPQGGHCEVKEIVRRGRVPGYIILTLADNQASATLYWGDVTFGRNNIDAALKQASGAQHAVYHASGHNFNESLIGNRYSLSDGRSRTIGLPCWDCYTVR